MKSIFYLLISVLYPLSIFAQKTAKPMVMLQVEGSWQVYDTDGKLCWKDASETLKNPRGYANGLFCASLYKANSPTSSPKYRQFLLNDKGDIAWSPKLGDVDYSISTPPDALGFALLTNRENGAGFICDKSGKMVSPEKEGLKYLGNGIIATALPPDPEKFDNQFFTFYDLTTKKVLFETFAYFVHDLKEGIICVETKEAENDNLMVKTFLNLKGEVIIPPQYFAAIEGDEAPFFKDGLIFLKNKTGISVFNKLGKKLFDKPVFDAKMMGKTLIKVQEIENNYFQIFKTDGSNLNEESYDEVGDVNENGIFYVKKAGKFHLMNTEGKTIKADLDYEQAFTSKTHIFLSKTASNYDVLDKNGLKTGNFKSDTLTNAPFGLTIFALNKQKGVINSEGKVVLKPANLDEIDVQEDYILTRVRTADDGMNFSFYSKEGKLLLDDIMTKLKSNWIMPIAPKEFYISY